MKISKASNKIVLFSDEKYLVNAGGSVSVFDISNSKGERLQQFNNLSNCSYVAVSSDDELIAYNNTSGYIVVHNKNTGELLLKNKCLSKEGGNLFFIQNNKKILSSEWDGKIYTLDIATNQVEVIADCKEFLSDIYQTPKDFEYIFFTTDNCEEKIMPTKISIINTVEGTITKLMEDHNRSVSSRAVFLFQDKLYFRSWDNRDGTEEISVYHFGSNKVETVVNIEKILKCMGIKTGISGSEGSLCISKTGKYLLAGYDDLLLIFNLKEKKYLNSITVKNITSLHFIQSDTKVVMGTWNGIYIVDLSTLLSGSIK